MGQFGIGQPLRRKEDPRLLQGRGAYTDDVNVGGQFWAAFLRSPHPHADILSLDTEAARAAPGVVAVFTAGDLDADGVPDMPCEVELSDLSGAPMWKPMRPILARGRVRFVGECVALVVARTPAQAREAADLVAVEWSALDSVADARDAVRPGAPAVWPELGHNVPVHWQNRDSAEADAAMAGAVWRVNVSIVNNRLVPAPMEPKGALAAWSEAEGKLTLWAPTQGGRRIQGNIARRYLRIPQDKVRVISQDVGGGFGMRGQTYPEYVAVAWAARKLRAAVKWRADRTETFFSDYHGRDQVNEAEMGLDQYGRIVALKVRTLVNLGAYMAENGPRMPIEGGGRIIPCCYHVPNFHFSVKPVFTNTVSTDTYRGAGRPEANFLMERLMDAAAEATGLSRDEVRRRNFITEFPYRTPMGYVIDSGDFARGMDEALRMADWDTFEERRVEAYNRGYLRGIGVAAFIEAAGGRAPTEDMRVRAELDGTVTIFSGSHAHGQGHDTVFSQLLNEYLGVEPGQVRLVQGDTDVTPKNAIGTFGSRSSMMGGAGIKMSCEKLIAKGTKVAAHLMQAEPEAVTFSDGVFRAGASEMTFAEVANAAWDATRIPEGMTPGLDEGHNFQREAENFPNGCHVCEVEIDPETGVAEIVRYVAVDDCGTVLNPLIVHGQVYGGVAQGLGQATIENALYDAGGQFISATYMDYGMPRAPRMPNVEAGFNTVPCRTNPLGVKGAGEAGACGAPPAFIGAVVDALRDYGVTHMDMPATPEKIWRAIYGLQTAA
ncbi:MAG: xanthine dehydrogenase family protein molybdopterin-binding subunit [Beijerinckiaceae bacterium]